MLRVALTGGIGAGKTEVSRRLAAWGAVVVDADLLAREVLEPGGPGLAAVVAEFGLGVLGADGALDRAALARMVFEDADARRRLEAIVHPLVRARAADVEAAAVHADPDAVVVHDIPLLVETGQADAYDAVIVVDAPDELRIRRLTTGRGMSEVEAKARIAAQASRAERSAVATHVVTNDGDLEELDARVRGSWSALRDQERSSRRPSG